MRRTAIALRGAKGFGWYKQFKENPESFSKFATPTPFDWNGDVKRPVAFIEVSSANEVWGNLEFELASDIVPKTVENFTKLITGDNKHGFNYKGTKLFSIRKGAFCMAGDVENSNGALSHSAFDERYFPDENFIIPHTSRGYLGTANVGVNGNGSQFYVTFSPAHHLNGRSVVFARLVKGEDVLARIEKVFTYKGNPLNDIVISNCGIKST